MWLRYSQPREPVRAVLGIKNVWIQVVVLTFLTQLGIVLVGLALAFGACALRSIPGWLTLSAALAMIVTGVVLSERSILRRQRLAVAERQSGRPSLDVFKELAQLARNPVGRRAFLPLLLFIAMMTGGSVAWRPVIVELVKRMPPPHCQAPARAASSATR